MSRTSGTQRQRGFTLLEVLVAMLILGVSVMGFAGLQVRALQSTGTAHVRSQGMTLAAETAERVRANSTAYGTYTTASNWSSTLPSGAPSTWGTCFMTAINSSGCSPSNMAKFDINEVRYLAQQLLPKGTVFVGNVPGSTCPTNLACVYVGWSGKNASADCIDNTTDSCVVMQVMAK